MENIQSVPFEPEDNVLDKAPPSSSVCFDEIRYVVLTYLVHS